MRRALAQLCGLLNLSLIGDRTGNYSTPNPPDFLHPQANTSTLQRLLLIPVLSTHEQAMGSQSDPLTVTHPLYVVRQAAQVGAGAGT